MLPHTLSLFFPVKPRQRNGGEIKSQKRGRPKIIIKKRKSPKQETLFTQGHQNLAMNSAPLKNRVRHEEENVTRTHDRTSTLVTLRMQSSPWSVARYTAHSSTFFCCVLRRHFKKRILVETTFVTFEGTQHAAKMSLQKQNKNKKNSKKKPGSS